MTPRSRWERPSLWHLGSDLGVSLSSIFCFQPGMCECWYLSAEAVMLACYHVSLLLGGL